MPDKRKHREKTPAGPPHLSLVVPIFNEETRLSSNIEKLLRWLESTAWSFELLLVDDGSTDGSRPIIEEFERTHAGIRALGYSQNRGRGHALRMGMLAARGSVLLTTEADLSWGTDSLALLAKTVSEDRADICVASPFCPGGGMLEVPAARRALSRLANLVAGLAVRCEITMFTGMTRAYRRELVADILSVRDGKEFHLDTLCRAVRSRLRIVEVPAVLSWRDAPDRSSRGPGPASLASSIASHLMVLAAHLSLSAKARRWGGST